VNVTLGKAPGSLEYEDGSVEKALAPFIKKADIDSVFLVNKQGDCLLTVGDAVEGAATIARCVFLARRQL